MTDMLKAECIGLGHTARDGLNQAGVLPKISSYRKRRLACHVAASERGCMKYSGKDRGDGLPEPSCVSSGVCIIPNV